MRTVLAALLAIAAAQAKPFARARPGEALVFPRDHFAHPAFKTEWWYFTGNLAAKDGEPFGYQLTFFRNAVGDGPRETPRASAWAADELLMAHFGLTDVAGGAHRSFEFLSRPAPGVAGIEADPFRIGVRDWTMVREGEGAYRLRAAAEGLAIDLSARATKPRVLQGDRGYSRKGRDPGNASYYVSFTRMETRGTVRARGKEFPVAGISWMDHEYSTSALDADQAGWDWFALHLDDGRDVMIYQLRRRDGAKGEFSSGTIVGKDGAKRALAAKDFTLTPGETWRSPRTGAAYPISWRISVPDAGIEATVRAAIPNQEMGTGIAYWEGAVTLTGSHAGRGYLEMTGYVGSLGTYLGR